MNEHNDESTNDKPNKKYVHRKRERKKNFTFCAVHKKKSHTNARTQQKQIKK